MRAALDRLRVFSLREFSTHRGRAIASTLVVAVSTALLVAVLAIITSIHASVNSIGDRVVGGASAEVAATSGAGLDGSMVAQVAGVDGVAAAVPLVQTTVASPDGHLLLMGSDASAAALHSPLQSMVSQGLGKLVTVPDGVLAGPDSGLVEGERLRVNGDQVSVAGVLHGRDAAQFNGGRYLFAPLSLAQKLSGRGEVVDSVLLVTRPGADREAVVDRVSHVVDGRGIVGPPNAERLETSNGVMLIRYVALSAAGMAFLVSAFLIYTAMSMAIAGRRQRVSMLRALGATRRSVVGDLVLETTVYALVGAVIGGFAGVALGRYSVDRLPAVFMQTVSAEIDFAVPAGVVVAAVLAAVAVCVAAAAFAARAVYKVSPVEALAPVGVSRIDRAARWTRIAAGVAGVLLAVVAVFNARHQPGILANSGITTMFAAEVALGYAFGGLLVRGAAAVARCFGGAGTLAAETIARAPRRSWATLMIVAVAVAASLAISAGNSNAVASTKASFASLRGGDIWVSTTAPGTFGVGPALPAGVAPRLAENPAVERVLEQRGTLVALGDERPMMFGVEQGSANPLLHAVDAQTAARVVAGDGVILSRDLADALSLRPGDRISLPTPTGVHSDEVLATVPFFSGLNGAAAMGLGRMQSWFGMSGASTLQLSLAPGADPAAVLHKVRSVVPQGDYVYTGEVAVGAFGDALAQATALDNILWMIVTIIAAVSVFNTLFLSVLERRRELGVLRAIGSSRRFLVRTVLIEALGLAAAGAAAGFVFGLVQQVVADMASSRAWNVDVAFGLVPSSFAIALGALVVCALGALPALKVSRMSITEAMRVE